MENCEALNGNELKKVQLEILDVVAGFCEKHDINYWLDFGTLIGCIRHKGYIPWDDDIDISMLRTDYNKFMRLFNEQNDRYKFCCYENDENFPYAYGKVLDTDTVLYEPDKNGNKLSINIDVFVYDNAPDDDKKIKKIYKKRDWYNLCQVARMHHGKVNGSIFKKIGAICLKIFTKLFPKNYFIKKIVRNAKQYESCQSKYVCDFSGNLTSFKCDTDWVAQTIYREFEGKNYRVPVEYDRLLRMTYGDYMIPPPAPKQVSHHKFEAYYVCKD